MSDDAFGELLKSFTESFENTGKRVGLGTQRVRSRPYSWNPFISWRDHEVRELRALYESVRAIFVASPFMSHDFLDETVTQILLHACRGLEATPGHSVLTATYGAIHDLVGHEFFWFPDLSEFDQWNELETATVLREYLERKTRMFAHHQLHFETGCRALCDLFGDILACVPAHLERDDDIGPAFSISLIDVVQRPAHAIERALTAPFAKELSNLELFIDLREQLEHNVLVASGVDSANVKTNTQLLLPTQARRKTPVELVESYLDATPFARFFNASLPLAIPDETRFEHCHILGGTGHGKTKLLQQLIYHDLVRAGEDGRSVVVLDSQGDLIRTISSLALFDPEGPLSDRLILIDPNDIDFPAALNMFDIGHERIDAYSRADRERILNGVVELYEYVFSALLGAELTQKQGVIFRYLARLMLVIPNATIQTLRQLMEDGRPFKQHMAALEGTARRFFEAEFFDPSFSATKKQILKRLWGVLANPVFERMFSYTDNKIDLFAAMNSGKIVLINTTKDLLKQEGCSIFGRFFIAKIAQAAMERATIPEDERRPAFVYIDEAHDYFDDNIEHLLSQARKYRVGMTLVHQNLDQLPPGLRSSVLANCSVRFAGGVSAKDAHMLSGDMRSEPDFLQEMRKHGSQTEFACFVKNTTDSVVRVTVPLGTVDKAPKLNDDEYAALIEHNRERYCVPLEEVDALIAASSTAAINNIPEEPPERPQAKPQPHQGPTSSKGSQTPRAKQSKPPPLTDPYLAGQGSREHKYLQHLVKQAAQERGYKALIEHRVLDGAGIIDVALERAERSVAVEISVTTTPEHEFGNVEKCLQAGYETVFLLSSNNRHLIALKRHIEPLLGAAQASRVRFALPDEFITHLDSFAAADASTETTVRGYKVKVRHMAGNPDNAAQRRQAIASVIARSAKEG